MDASEGGCPRHDRLVARPPCHTLTSDASKHVVEGSCLETGQYWRYNLSQEELARFCGSSKHIQSEDNICVNALALLGMVMSAHMLVLVYGEHPVGDKDCVLLRSDNEAAVHWVRRRRGGGVRSFDRGLSCA